jgi:oxygen-independent coproporphyrinogen-3 oxidase
VGHRELERHLPVPAHCRPRIAQRATPGTALYVHFPFCASKCSYCDFYSLPGAGQDSAGALRGLDHELERRAPRSPATVFLGGGTPSYHSTAELVAFLDRLDQWTGFRGSAEEVTIECNPESLDLAKARALLAAGVTRFSIGVQSLQPAVLQRFGRVHGVEQSFAAVAAARRAGARRLSVDLIYAVPGQSLEQWCSDLERLLALGLEHLSAYNLTVEEGTALERERREGLLPEPDEDRELAMFWATRERCAAAGLPAYEISNFARPGEACRHNLAYWRGADYVGVGPSAVSRLGELRFGNPRSLTDWSRALGEDGVATAWAEELSPRQRWAEAWWLGLRLQEGIDPATARENAGLDHAAGESVGSQEAEALAIAERLVAAGWLERRGDRFALTRQGLPLADAVAREFLGLAAR